MTPMDRSTNDAKIEKRLRIRKKDDEIVCVLVREREREGGCNKCNCNCKEGFGLKYTFTLYFCSFARYSLKFVRLLGAPGA